MPNFFLPDMSLWRQKNHCLIGAHHHTHTHTLMLLFVHSHLSVPGQVVRVLVTQRGFMWTPIVELKTVAKQPTDNHWVIGVSSTDVLCVICKGATYPKVLPRPITTTLPLRMPLVSLTDTVAREEIFLRSKINFEHLVAAEELDEDDADDRRLMAQLQHKMDQHMIHCISRAVQAQKPGRALELTTLLYVTVVPFPHTTLAESSDAHPPLCLLILAVLFILRAQCASHVGTPDHIGRLEPQQQCPWRSSLRRLMLALATRRAHVGHMHTHTHTHTHTAAVRSHVLTTLLSWSYPRRRVIAVIICCANL
jgi:hypothetical protein